MEQAHLEGHAGKYLMPSGGIPVVAWAVGLHSGRKVQHAL